jgi:serine/threonine protein kinase
MAQQRDKPIGFKTVQLLKDETLGIGSYGKVCKAKCDDLLCAAKLIHETLFDPTAQQLIAPQREHRLPMRRFEQECEFLSTIRHPNIVQYLGIYRDPDTGLPALLMELMDDSLTHFLESSPQPVPYHIQVNVCHDVTLALSFLHSNGIIHRDLSSNNVLLRSNVLAKVTDFGMAARLGDQNPRATQLTFTMCPGTDVYMPPEAVLDKPVYTEKIDCFSFGVIVVQTITREFPKPGDRRKRIQINQPGLPPIVEVPISEIERRQNHISEIDSNHTLLQVALDCLKDEDIERPSAQQLYERVAALKEHPHYSESVRVVEARSTAEQGRSEERERELREQHSQEVQSLRQIIQEKDQAIIRKDQTVAQNYQALREKDETVTELEQREREKSAVIENKETELRQKVGEISRLERQLGESEQVIAQFQRRITELEQLRPATDATPRSKEHSSSRASIKLTWREGKKAVPQCMQSDSYSVGVDSSTLYIRTWSREIFGYNTVSSSWSQLPSSPTNNCPSVIINNLLTLVGGTLVGIGNTNQLFSLTGEGSDRKWTEEFPPMPTKRWGSTALCIGTALIVAGGRRVTVVVEVMNIATKQWSTAADLPQPVLCAPAAVCGDQVYILERSKLYTSSAAILTQPQSLNVWSEIAAPPVTETTCVSIHGRLLTIGGMDSVEEPTRAIHMYNPTTDSWEVISHMETPRKGCIAAVLPNNQLMVVGGRTGKYGRNTDSTELAAIDLL